MAASGFRYSGVSEQAGASIKRLADSRALLRYGSEQPNGGQQPSIHTRGAMYLAGYSIECRIKAIAMERNACTTLQQLRKKLKLAPHDVFSHELPRLMRHLLGQTMLDRIESSKPGVKQSWSQAREWNPQWRYDKSNPNQSDAERFVDAVNSVWDWLGKTHEKDEKPYEGFREEAGAWCC